MEKDKIYTPKGKSAFIGIPSLIPSVVSYCKEILSTRRYEHCLRVGELSRELAAIHGEEEEASYLAGVSHDMMKELSSQEMLDIAARDGREITLMEKENPALLHGRAAALVLQEKFKVTDKRVIEAVACHTFAKRNMCNIAKIVYAADKIEPARPFVTAEYLRRKKSLPLNVLALEVANECSQFLRSKGKVVAEETEDFISWLLEEVESEKISSGKL